MAFFYVICSFTDSTFHEDIEVYVGDKVTLSCSSPIDSPNSVMWRHRSSSFSNDSAVLLKIEGDHMSHFDTSGRLALNQTGRDDYRLVIHDVQQSDAGRYTCCVDAAFEKQHITVLRVKGIV